MVFVVIDGLDGSGKSTQARLLCRRIAKEGGSFIVRSHPSSDNFLGRMGRGYLLMEGRKARIAASFFYLMDVIRSLILYKWRNVDYVIFVRYLMGTAYLPAPLHKFSYYFFYRSAPISQHMYFIDVTPEIAYQRIEMTRTEKEMFESLEKLVQVREKALDLAQSGGWTIVKGDASVDAVHRRLLQSLGFEE